MQVLESEMVIHLKYNSLIRNAIIKESVFIVFFAGLFSYLIIQASQIAASTSQFPAIRVAAYKEMISVVLGLFLILLLYGLIITFQVRQLRRNLSPQLRINHEGIFFASPSFLIRWEEIKELSPFSFLGSPFLGIVPWDTESTVARAKASSGYWFRFELDLNQWIVRHSESLAPFGVAQRVLPIPIGELITAIQEHFAAELREHHITVLGW